MRFIGVFVHKLSDGDLALGVRPQFVGPSLEMTCTQRPYFSSWLSCCGTPLI